MTDDLGRDVATIQGIDAVGRILDVVCQLTGMGFAAVARVTQDRWICCEVRDRLDFGLQPGGELKIETTICQQVRDSRQVIVINHVSESPTWCGHPVPETYGFESYISVPIVTSDGRFFGTLCALDPRPARIESPEIVGMVQLFAELIAAHLDAHERATASQELLADERRSAELREQFIAVLGHDLRNPLAAIQSGARLLAKEAGGSLRATTLASGIEASVQRMSRLIGDVMDFARGRLGGGVPLRPSPPIDLGPILRQVIQEVSSAAPERNIVLDVDQSLEVACDPDRIGQLLSNLLSNAVTHGAAGHPVTVAAHRRAGVFEFRVGNGGTPIPTDERARLFEPFQRSPRNGSDNGGLGLGLYIASEIARAHHGSLAIESTEAETAFTFRMPAVS